MNIIPFEHSYSDPVQQLYRAVFAQSEGQAEGDAIGGLVLDMLNTTAMADLYGFLAYEDGELLGAILFTRMTFESAIEAFILSPVAVRSDRQGQGIGQALIQYGLDQLSSDGVSLAFTYGDPKYYSQVGFQPITEDQIQAPQPLSQPIGWLCQSLNGEAIPNLTDKPICVSALNKPEFW